MQAGHLEMVVCKLAGNLLHRWEGGSRVRKRWRSESMRKRRRSDENRLLCIGRPPPLPSSCCSVLHTELP